MSKASYLGLVTQDTTPARTAARRERPATPPGTPKSVRLEIPLDDANLIETFLTLTHETVGRALLQCRNKQLRSDPETLAIIVRKSLEAASQAMRNKSRR